MRASPLFCAQVPISAYYARDAQNVKREHVATWQELTSRDIKIEEVPGNHLFFYQYDVRNEWMEAVLKGAPEGIRG
jgi:surfactin synthase thioesterase subunit